jgi:hypothetical protein
LGLPSSVLTLRFSGFLSSSQFFSIIAFYPL